MESFRQRLHRHLIQCHPVRQANHATVNDARDLLKRARICKLVQRMFLPVPARRACRPLRRAQPVANMLRVNTQRFRASRLILAPGQLNQRGGRDHHRYAMSVAMLGGGVRGGRAIGETDREGGQIITPGWSANRPIYLEDIAATIYSALGINWTKSITDTPSGRRFEYVPYADQGRFQPVNEVFD